jgi:hypothetical protein
LIKAAEAYAHAEGAAKYLSVDKAGRACGLFGITWYRFPNFGKLLNISAALAKAHDFMGFCFFGASVIWSKRIAKRYI